MRGLLEKLEKFADKFDSERNIYMIAAKLFRFKLKVFSKEWVKISFFNAP